MKANIKKKQGEQRLFRVIRSVRPQTLECFK